MKTLVINVDSDASAKLLIDLAKKMHFKARILSDQQKEDAGLLAMMEKRKKEKTTPVSKTLNILRKIK